MDWNRFAVPINGFLMPLVAVLTLANNALVLAVLLHRKMRSPTNALLAALAVSDTLMSVCPLPCFVHFYTVGQRYLDWVPYSWCFAYFALTDYLPTVFHTASIWLTTSLAAQRYARVCCSIDSKVRLWLCSMRSAVCIVASIYAAAVVSQASRLGEFTFSAVQVPSLLIQSINHDVDEELNSTTTVVKHVTACRYELTAFIARHETVYYNVYYWSRVILIHVIPCSALVVLNASLIRAMRAAHQHRRQMLQQETPTTSVRHQLTCVTVTEAHTSQHEMQPIPSCYTSATTLPRQHRSDVVSSSGGNPSTRATAMLTTVVGVFLLVEVPLSLSLIHI